MNISLRDAYIKLILSIKPNVVMTLTEGRGFDLVTAELKITHFLNRAQRIGLGHNWYKWPAAQRIKAVGFREKHDTFPHWHLALHAPGDLPDALHQAKVHWPRLAFRGEAWVDVIDSPRNYAEYITKTFYIPDTAENVFSYSPIKFVKM